MKKSDIPDPLPSAIRVWRRIFPGASPHRESGSKGARMATGERMIDSPKILD